MGMKTKLVSALAAVAVLAGMLALPLAAVRPMAEPEGGAEPCATPTDVGTAAEIIVTGVGDPFTPLYLPVGTDVQTLLDDRAIKGSINVVLENGGFLQAPVAWDVGSFNSSVVGVQMLRGQVELWNIISGDHDYVYYEDGVPAEMWVERAIEVYDGEPQIKTPVTSWLSSFAYFALPKGGDVTGLDLSADSIINIRLGGWSFTPCDITWDYASFTANKTGRQYLRGTVELPATHAYFDAKGRPSELWVQRPVWVNQKGMKETEPMDLDGMGDLNGGPYHLAVGDAAGLQALKDIGDNSAENLVTEDDYRFRTSLRFDDSKVKVDTPGTYYPLVPQTPPGFVVHQNELNSVIVLRDDIVDLSGSYFEPYLTAMLALRWLLPVSNAAVKVMENADPYDEENAALWVDIDDVVHLSTDYMDPTDCTDSTVYFSPSHYRDPTPPGIYHLKIVHDGGESNIITIEVDESGFELREIGGDKDGGDGDDQDLPDLEQDPPKGGGTPPAPTTGDDPAPAPDADTPTTGQTPARQLATRQQPAAGARPTERLSADATTVSGLRLADMMRQQGDSVLFQKKGISTLFDAAFLQGLGLADDDMFTVTLEDLGGGRYRVGAEVNGVALKAIPGTRVQIWYTLPAGAPGVVVTDEAGSQLAAEYDEADALVSFTVDLPGVYTLTAEQAAALAAAPPTANVGAGGLPGFLLPLAGTIAGGGLLLAVALRRRARKVAP